MPLVSEAVALTVVPEANEAQLVGASG